MFFSPAGSYLLVHPPTEEEAESDQTKYVYVLKTEEN